MTFATTFASRAPWLFAVFTALSAACSSKDDATKETTSGYATSTQVSSTTASASGGVGGQGAALPGCDPNAAGGAGGAAEPIVNMSRVGLRAEPRPDDDAVVTALGGIPYPAADPYRAAKNAFLRVEFGLGTEVGKSTKLRMDHQFRALGDPSWPTAYDAWSAGNARHLILSVSSVDPKVGPVSYCELAGTPTFDPSIVAAGGRLRTFVDDNVAEALYLAWGHERVPLDLRPTLTTLNAVTFKGTPDQLVVETRVGVGVTCAIPKGKELIFRSPDGKSTLKTLTYQAAKVGDQNVYVSAPDGTIGVGWTVTSQTPSELSESYIAAWKKVRATMASTWPNWAGSSKVRWTWVVPHDSGLNMMASYPGDDQVDVVGVDAVNLYGVDTYSPWVELESMLASMRLFAAKHGGKDVVVASTAALDGARTKTTEPAADGAKSVVVTPLPLPVAPGIPVFFYDALGHLLAKGITSQPSLGGSEVLVLDLLEGDVPAGATVLLRMPAFDKAAWIEHARAFLKCAPDVKGVVWFTGAPGGFWLDQGPEAAPDVLDAFRGWATDPYFGE